MWGADTMDTIPMFVCWGEIKLPHLDYYLKIWITTWGSLLSQACFEKWEKCKDHWEIPVIITSPAVLWGPNAAYSWYLCRADMDWRLNQGHFHKLWEYKDSYGLFFSLDMSGCSIIPLRGRGEKREYRFVGDVERFGSQASASWRNNLSKKAFSDSNTWGNFLICFLRCPWAFPQKTEFHISMPPWDQTALFYSRPR